MCKVSAGARVGMVMTITLLLEARSQEARRLIYELAGCPRLLSDTFPFQPPRTAGDIVCILLFH